MRILVVTNLYPPQELGGYGRCISDFVWGLQRRGHQLQVLTSDAPYLGAGGDGPSGEPVDRRLQLKGSFKAGVQHLQDLKQRLCCDRINAELVDYWLSRGPWDGILLGNLDLLGVELLQMLLRPAIPLLHHVGFVDPPYDPKDWPVSRHYRLVAASMAVRQSLMNAGLPVSNVPVVYPGARVDLFGPSATGRDWPGLPDGTSARPLRICFAGLMMSSKGPHTVLEAVDRLVKLGLEVHAMFAGGHFQSEYIQRMKSFIHGRGLESRVILLGNLKRDQLARFFSLHHVAVFPSIYPEAFGIVAAEAMASGLALVSSGAGGASEVFEHGKTGFRFQPGNADELVAVLKALCAHSDLLDSVRIRGSMRVREAFSVEAACCALEHLFLTSQ